MTTAENSSQKPVCGECSHFQHEDASGDGYCDLLDLLPRCDTPYCGIFFKPITAA